MKLNPEKRVAVARAHFTNVADNIKNGKRGIIPAFMFGAHASSLIKAVENMAITALSEGTHQTRTREKVREMDSTGEALHDNGWDTMGFNRLEKFVARRAMHWTGGYKSADRVEELKTPIAALRKSL